MRHVYDHISQLDYAKLSLAEQRLMAEKATQLERAQLARTKYEDTIRTSVGAAAALQRLSEVDKTKPSADSEVAKIVNDIPESLASPAFRQQLQDFRADRTAFQKAEAARSSASFNNPIVSKKFNDIYDATNDIELANAAAKATEETYNKARGLATNVQDLSDPNDRNAALGILQAGNLDSPDVQNQLTQLQMKAETAKSSRTASSDKIKTATQLADLAKKLAPSPTDLTPESPAAKAAREGLHGPLNDYLSAIKQDASPGEVTPASSAADFVRKNSGASAPAAPAPGTPPVTPAQAAASPQPAPAEETPATGGPEVAENE